MSSVSSWEGRGRGVESSLYLGPMSPIITQWASFCLGTLRPRHLPSTLPASMSTCPEGEKPGVSPDPDLGWDGHRMSAIPVRVWSRAARTKNKPLPRQGGDQGSQWPRDQRRSRVPSSHLPRGRAGPGPRATAGTSEQSGRS